MGRIKDLTGRRFGKLLVLSLDTSIKLKPGQHARWICQCDCGAICSKDSNQLQKSGDNAACSKSCQALIPPNTIFGRLTVIRPLNKRTLPSSGGHVIYECRCECGTIVEVASSSLRLGRTVSCGCYRKEKAAEAIAVDIRGKKYNYLTALELTKQRYKNNIIWRCQCECGNITYATYTQLRTNNKISCGCLHYRGEAKIIKILQENNIEFQHQYINKDCILSSGGYARFDFFINNQYIIEYDGILHFDYTDSGWNTKERYEHTTQSDSDKNKWCKDNNIPLIRIPYTHYDNICIDDLLLETSQFVI